MTIRGMADRKARKSEFEYTGEHADDVRLVLMPEDIEIFKLLWWRRFHTLPGPWFEPFLDRAYTANLDNRLARLARHSKHGDGRPWLIRHKQETRKSKDSVYELHPNAYVHFNETSQFRTDPLQHRILEDLVQASIELGVLRNPEFRIKRTDISVIGGRHPDGNVYTIQDRKNHTNYIKEIQRSRNNPKNRERIKDYKRIMDDEVYKTEHDLENLVILYVFKNEEEKNEIKRIITEVYCPDCEGTGRHNGKKCKHEKSKCKHIGLKAWCDPWSIAEMVPKPTDMMFTEGWERVGYPPAYLNKLWEA